MFETIEYEIDEDTAIAHVRLNRPDKLNALSGTLIDEYVQAIEQADDDADVRTIVVSGNGEEAFSAGYDMQPSGETENPNPSVDDQLDGFQESTRHVYAAWEANKPVIAAIDGYCVAGGSDMALACDLVFATESSQLGYPGIRQGGSPPTMVYPVVMNLHQAKELLFSGKLVDADEALRLGMINDVVPDGELMDRIEGEAREIQKMPGNNVRILKKILNGYADQNGARTMFDYGQLFDALAHKTEYGQEYYRRAEAGGMDAALEFMNELDKGMRPSEGEMEASESDDD